MCINLSETDCLEAIYNGVPIIKLHAPDIKDSYNNAADILELEKLPDTPKFSNNWFMPDEFQNIDLVKYFSSKIKTNEEALRVAEELDLFMQTSNEQLLRYLIYLGKIIKDNKIITGVGRGSSVSLYCLFLCGIHKCNSIKFNLDYHDFFKTKLNIE